MHRVRLSLIVFLAALTAAGVPLAAAQGTGFDTPLTEFEHYTGGELHIAVGGVGTGEGAHTFEIDVPGDPLAAWLYWSGQTSSEGNPDSEVTLEGGALTGPLALAGVEVGRRYQVYPDESATKNGEVAMRAIVPLYALSPGLNSFSVSGFNDAVSGSRPYAVQHGLMMAVVYQVVPGEGDWEAIALEGADIANYDRFGKTFDHPEQGNGEVTCFDFKPLGCEVTGRLSLGIGGVLEDVHQIAGSTRVAYASPERTWFATGSGPHPAELVGTYQILEENRIIDADFGFRGEKLGVFTTQVDLPQGATWACYQHEMLPKKSTDEFPQNFTGFFAGLELNTSCRPPGQCALDLALSLTPADVTVGEAECDGAITRVTFEYNGQGCEASTSQQGHDTRCEGAAAFAENVSLRLSSPDGALIGRVDGLGLGDLASFNARQAGLADLGRTVVAEVIDESGAVVETNRIRMKCEKKFNAGDQFGSLLAVAYTTDAGTVRDLRTATTVSYTVTNNGTGETGELRVLDDLLGEVGYAATLMPGESRIFTADTTTWKQTRFDAQATGEWDCATTGAALQTFTEPVDDDGLECEGGLKSLTLTYTGGGCDGSTHDQNGKMRCKETLAPTGSVDITVLNRKGRTLERFTGVAAGSPLSIGWTDLAPEPPECGKRAKRKRPRKHKRRLPGNLIFEISDAQTGESLQGVTVHTSCSQPLAPGDQFGALQVEGFVSRR